MFKGYFVKIGDFVITGRKYIKPSSYKCPQIIMDVDSYNNADGDLIRTVLPNPKAKVEFETMDGLSNDDVGFFYQSISANYIDPMERSFEAEVYIPELNDYAVHKMYLVQPEPVIKQIVNGKLIYESIRVAMAAY